MADILGFLSVLALVALVIFPWLALLYLYKLKSIAEDIHVSISALRDIDNTIERLSWEIREITSAIKSLKEEEK